jgi:di/tricarboxylate transporter
MIALLPFTIGFEPLVKIIQNLLYEESYIILGVLCLLWLILVLYPPKIHNLNTMHLHKDRREKSAFSAFFSHRYLMYILVVTVVYVVFGSSLYDGLDTIVKNSSYWDSKIDTIKFMEG